MRQSELKTVDDVLWMGVLWAKSLIDSKIESGHKELKKALLARKYAMKDMNRLIKRHESYKNARKSKGF